MAQNWCNKTNQFSVQFSYLRCSQKRRFSSYVLDFRKLNANSHTDKYSMKSVEECIGDIGRSGSTIFSTLDLSSGFWQLPLAPESQKCTAFTVQNQGQFQWTRTSQGLHSAPSQYQRLMELTVKGHITLSCTLMTY